MKSKSQNKLKCWAYFDPHGNVQVRTISKTKKISQEYLPMIGGDSTYQDYETEGFYLKKILFTIEVIDS